MNRNVLMVVLIVAASVAAFYILPHHIGLICDTCGCPITDHKVVASGTTPFGDTWQHIKCPTGQVVGALR